MFYFININLCKDITRISRLYSTERTKLHKEEKIYMWAFGVGCLFFLPVVAVFDSLKFIFTKLLGATIRLLLRVKNKLNKIRNK